VLFNNCKARPHTELYGPGAFYDLNLVGAQANMATNLQQGQHCCAATPVEKRNIKSDIIFHWFCFSHEQIMEMPDKPGTTVRVFFGEWLGSERLPRAAAVAKEPYTWFFNVKGQFKQLSAIQPRGHCAAPAGLCRG